MSIKLHSPVNVLRLGLADNIADLHRVPEIGAAAGLKIILEDISATAAYEFSIDESEWDRACLVLSSSHLYRSGDLRIFLYPQKITRKNKRTQEIEESYREWRLPLRKRDTIHRSHPD